MFHVDNNFSISLLVFASNMKNFFANISRIAVNLTVHRNDTIALPKSYVINLLVRHEFKATLFLLCLKNCIGSPLVYSLLLQMERIVYNHELHVYVTSENCQNNYHKLCQHVNIQRTSS